MSNLTTPTPIEEQIRKARVHRVLQHEALHGLPPELQETLPQKMLDDGTTPDETHLTPLRAGRAHPSNVRPAYQNTSTAMSIAITALNLAADTANMEGAPPALISNLRSQAARLTAVRIEVMKGNPA